MSCHAAKCQVHASVLILIHSFVMSDAVSIASTIASTVLNLDSDSDDEDVIMMAESYSRTPIGNSGYTKSLCSREIQLFWTRRTSNFTKVYGDTLCDTAISWQVSGNINAADDLKAQIRHGRSVINDIISQEYLKAFKIGITYKPWLRFRSRRFGYVNDGWSNMIVICVSDRPDLIAQLERALVSEYRRHDRRGYLVNADGHFKCCNRAPGGEGAFHGVSPFCCYVVVERSRFRLRRSM